MLKVLGFKFYEFFIRAVYGKGGGESLDMLLILNVSRPLVFLMPSEKFRRQGKMSGKRRRKPQNLLQAAAAEITQVP